MHTSIRRSENEQEHGWGARDPRAKWKVRTPLVRMDSTAEALRGQAQDAQICSLSIPCSHKDCLLVLQGVKMMFTIVLDRIRIHEGPDHLFTTGLGGASKEHDLCRQSSSLPQAG